MNLKEQINLEAIIQTCKENKLLAASVVFAIASIVIPFTFSSGASLDEQRKMENDFVSIYKAIKMLEKDTGELTGHPGPNPCVNDPEFTNLSDCKYGLTCQDGTYDEWNGPYIEKIPKDPWGRDYYIDNDYVKNGLQVRVLASFGPNGVQDYGEKGDDKVYVLCARRGAK